MDAQYTHSDYEFEAKGRKLWHLKRPKAHCNPFSLSGTGVGTIFERAQHQSWLRVAQMGVSSGQNNVMIYAQYDPTVRHQHPTFLFLERH